MACFGWLQGDDSKWHISIGHDVSVCRKDLSKATSNFYLIYPGDGVPCRNCVCMLLSILECTNRGAQFDFQ